MVADPLDAVPKAPTPMNNSTMPAMEKSTPQILEAQGASSAPDRLRADHAPAGSTYGGTNAGLALSRARHSSGVSSCMDYGVVDATSGSDGVRADTDGCVPTLTLRKRC